MASKSVRSYLCALLCVFSDSGSLPTWEALRPLLAWLIIFQMFSHFLIVLKFYDCKYLGDSAEQLNGKNKCQEITATFQKSVPCFQNRENMAAGEAFAGAARTVTRQTKALWERIKVKASRHHRLGRVIHIFENWRKIGRKQMTMPDHMGASRSASPSPCPVS